MERSSAAAAAPQALGGGGGGGHYALKNVAGGSTPQLVEQKRAAGMDGAQRQDGSGELAKPGSQPESGYSSMASSQNYLVQTGNGGHIREQLQSLADAAVHGLPLNAAGKVGSLSKPPLSSAYNSSQIAPHHHASTQGAGQARVGDSGMNAPLVGRESHIAQQSPVLSRLVPPSPPQPPQATLAPVTLPASAVPSHPTRSSQATDSTPSKTEEADPSPATPPKAHSPTNSKPTAIPTSNSPPAAIAGAKRTSSGVVKPALAVSEPNSPMEVIYSHTGTGGAKVPTSPIVDPGRIQELSAQLRTRLKYARIKVDNNWTTKSLDQVESIYHSNQNSPARIPARGVKRDSPEEGSSVEHEDGLADFGPPIHAVRRHHVRTASEPMNSQYHHMGAQGMGAAGEKTYENFWKERAPFTTKMLEKMTTTPGGQSQQGSGGQYYQQQDGRGQQHQQQPLQTYTQSPYPHHHHHHNQQPYSQVRSPAGGENGQYPQNHHNKQQPTYSPSHRAIRPPPALTPSHSNLSAYSTTYKDSESTAQPPATPLRHRAHPPLSRGTSSKSAEEEAVESLMFLMSSPGNNSTPRREPRMVQGYALNVNGGHPVPPRRGSILSRENSSGWGEGGGGGGGEVDLDVTDAEEVSGSGAGEEDEVPEIYRRKGEQDAAVAVAVGGYNRRRSNSGSGVLGGRFDRVVGGGGAKMKHSHQPPAGVLVHHQERITKPGAGGTPKKKLGVGVGVGGGGGGVAVAGGAPQGAQGRRLAPGFSPS